MGLEEAAAGIPLAVVGWRAAVAPGLAVPQQPGHPQRCRASTRWVPVGHAPAGLIGLCVASGVHRKARAHIAAWKAGGRAGRLPCQVKFVNTELLRRPFGPCPLQLQVPGPGSHREVENPEAASCNAELRKCAQAGDAEEAVKLVEDMWKRKLDPDARTYALAISACRKAQDEERAGELLEELRAWGPENGPERFQLAPVVNWNRQLRRAGCSIRNTLDWKGEPPLPQAEDPGSCWLLPSQDGAAEHLARRQAQLRHLGWKVLSCSPAIVATLRSKTLFYEYVESLGLAEYLPQRYASPVEASYPCIVKPAMGTWGKDASIVYSSEEVLRVVRKDEAYQTEQRVQQEAEYMASYYTQWGQERDAGEAWAETAEKVEQAVCKWVEASEQEPIGGDWLLQELVPGSFEYSTTLLVHRGEILDVLGTRYKYAGEVYVWPRVTMLETIHVSVPGAHVRVMSTILAGFSGICNFNYKLRRNGKLCIFEVNPRVGGDVVFDLPRPRVRAMFEKLDALFS